MSTQILCIDGSDGRRQRWGKEMEQDGCVVIHAADEAEAAHLLKASSVDMVCIDSGVMTERGSSAIRDSLKNAHTHVPIVLIQSSSEIPPHFEERVDVVIDEPTFSTLGPWLIEQLREIRFPLFVEWFENWKRRSDGNGGESFQNAVGGPN